MVSPVLFWRCVQLLHTAPLKLSLQKSICSASGPWTIRLSIESDPWKTIFTLICFSQHFSHFPLTLSATFFFHSFEISPKKKPYYIIQFLCLGWLKEKKKSLGAASHTKYSKSEWTVLQGTASVFSHFSVPVILISTRDGGADTNGLRASAQWWIKVIRKWCTGALSSDDWQKHVRAASALMSHNRHRP